MLIFFHVFQHLLDSLFCICHDGNIYLYISGDCRRINIDMYNLCIRCEGMQFSGDSVIKPCSDGKQEITFVDRHIAGIGAMHSQIPNVIRMIRRNTALSHDRCHNRNFRPFYQFCKDFPCPGNVHTASGQKQWFLRLTEHFDRTFQLSDMYTCARLISSDIYGFRIFRTSKFCHHILRQINQYRSRTSCLCNVKGLFDDPPQGFSLSDRHAIFGNTSGNSYDIHFLKGGISN